MNGRSTTRRQLLAGALGSGFALAVRPSASKKSIIRVYPKVGHAFLADYRPSFEPESAADGWRRMLAWFKANGVA